uniref:Uncharacterized protein n=1 Tax=Arundo donax TaxID=35708 RepID=A0A0A9ERU0_ARUDO
MRNNATASASASSLSSSTSWRRSMVFSLTTTVKLTLSPSLNMLIIW